MRKFLLAAVIALAAVDVHAVTSLAWVCGDTTRAGQPVASACSPQRWDYADRGLVAEGMAWETATWRVTATGTALACSVDLAPGSTAACGAAYSGERWLPAAQLARSSVTPPVVNPPPAPANGTVLLSWTLVAQDADVTLTAIDIWQAASASGPWNSVSTLAPTATMYTVNGLAVGTWFWYVTAAAGSTYSLPSNIVSKTITGTTPPPPPPPPVNPCVADPLTVTNLAWPAAQSGRRSLGYNTGTKLLASLVFTAPNRIVFTDTRGCTVTVTR